MHDGGLSIDEALVRLLIDDQFAQWSQLPIARVTPAGTVHGVFRLGDSMSVRLPLLPGDPDEVRQVLVDEARAASEFWTLSPVPCPRPIALGDPGHGYPLPWSVQTWVPGRDALAVDPAASESFAQDLASLLVGLRAADTRGRGFRGAGRGGRLTDHDEWMELCFARSEGLVDVVRLRALWQELRLLPRVDGDVMCHGDLTPQNVLVEGGRLAGVLDTGGFAAADPALDLVSVWHLLDGERRTVVRRRLGCSTVQWQRGMAWALQQAMGLVWYYAESHPVMSRWGRRTLNRLLEAAPT
ncbi:MAG: phosphotransferase [Candidatus Nanopelagicales bacterium]